VSGRFTELKEMSVIKPSNQRRGGSGVMVLTCNKLEDAVPATPEAIDVPEIITADETFDMACEASEKTVLEDRQEG
jgi:hypothetical protein